MAGGFLRSKMLNAEATSWKVNKLEMLVLKLVMKGLSTTSRNKTSLSYAPCKFCRKTGRPHNRNMPGSHGQSIYLHNPTQAGVLEFKCSGNQDSLGEGPRSIYGLIYTCWTMPPHYFLNPDLPSLSFSHLIIPWQVGRPSVYVSI